MAADFGTITLNLSEESVAVIERLIAAIQIDIESRESRSDLVIGGEAPEFPHYQYPGDYIPDHLKGKS